MDISILIIATNKLIRNLYIPPLTLSVDR